MRRQNLKKAVREETEGLLRDVITVVREALLLIFVVAVTAVSIVVIEIILTRMISTVELITHHEVPRLLHDLLSLITCGMTIGLYLIIAVKHLWGVIFPTGRKKK